MESSPCPPWGREKPTQNPQYLVDVLISVWILRLIQFPAVNPSSVPNRRKWISWPYRGVALRPGSIWLWVFVPTKINIICIAWTNWVLNASNLPHSEGQQTWGKKILKEETTTVLEFLLFPSEKYRGAHGKWTKGVSLSLWLSNTKPPLVNNAMYHHLLFVLQQNFRAQKSNTGPIVLATL